MEKSKPKGINEDTADSEDAVTNNCGYMDDGPRCKVAKINADDKTTPDLTLNHSYTTPTFTEQLRIQWSTQEKEDFHDLNTDVSVYKDPFQVCLLPDLLQNKTTCRQLVDEMVQKVQWSRKQMDLYEFYQSTDLSNMAECKLLTNFLQMLRRTVRPWLEALTGLKLDYVSASCSMYTCGDYLLVHDDLLKDRQIAFIYYLSPWENVETWREEQGGCLELFSSDERCFPLFPVKRKISPKNNQFAFFKVGSRSFHQVGEVTSFDYPRLTINGWFHGASNDDFITDIMRPFAKLEFTTPANNAEFNVDEFLNEVYLKSQTKKSIQKRIEDNSEICLYEFLRRETFEQTLEQLLHDETLKWRLEGPANAHNYEVLDINTASKTISHLITLFSCAEMFNLLHDYTDLDLAGPNATNPKYNLQVQRWSHGNYTVLGDGAICEENTLDLIYYLNASEGAASITYLSPEVDEPMQATRHANAVDNNMYENDEEDDSVLLTITPVDNALNIVYRCEDKYRLFASMAFMIVVIIVGVPMWWKTTEVYRVNLPSADIMSLSDEPLEIAIKIVIFSFKNERGELLVKELSEAYANNELWRPKFIQIPIFEKALNTRTPAGLESLLLKQEEIKAGDFIFIEWPKLQEEVLLTSDRSALIRSDTSASRIKNVINLLILQTHRIQQILNEDYRYAVKTEAPQTEYDVVVSILNPRPDIMNAKWNVRMAVETYIAPFLKEVSQISNYTLTTQWKYQLPFEADLKQVRDSSKFGRHYALGETDLPHIITSIEKNLGVGITAKPAINLVVYITPCDIAPVHIYNRHNKQATRQKVDSFISPKWGGIIIFNPPVEACMNYNTAQQPVEFYVNTNDVMQIMLYQLQKLLDINVEFTMDGVKTVALEQIAPRRWEYEAYIRRSAVMHITTASNTLQSLIKLLDNISYIVINDDVGESINNAYESLLLAKQALAKGDLLAASGYARSAFIASEHAFFDASLLAQLYFPDEQKYAIYIPLFLPIMVPVITSFTMIRKLLTKLRSPQKEKCA